MTGARVLIVDDDPAVQRGVGGLLRDEGYAVTLAGSAAQAAAALAGDDPPGWCCWTCACRARAGSSSWRGCRGRCPRRWWCCPARPPRRTRSRPCASARSISWRSRPPPAPPPAAGVPAGLGERTYRDLVDDLERGLLRAALARAGGNVAEAARLLRADRAYIYRRIKALGVVADG